MLWPVAGCWPAAAWSHSPRALGEKIENHLHFPPQSLSFPRRPNPPHQKQDEQISTVIKSHRHKLQWIVPQFLLHQRRARFTCPTMIMFPSAPTLSTVSSALPFSLPFSFQSDTPSARRSAPSSLSSSSSHSSVSSSVASSSPQSYRASPLSSLSNSSYWANEDQLESSHPQIRACTHKSVQVSCPNSVTARFSSSQSRCNTRPEVQPDAVPIEQRQHPRRTHRVVHVDSRSGNATAPVSRAPPALVRQSERKEVFVDSLVGKPIAC